MADIASRYQGNATSSGKRNWRGDQTSVPEGGQSVYESSSVALADLGSRAVVGDRVFRYAKCGIDAIGAGMACQYGGERLASILVGTASAAAGSRLFTITAATAISLDTYKDGYLVCGVGATDSNLGMIYGIKGNAVGSAAATCQISLYDEVKYVQQATSTWAVFQNLYMNVASAAANAAPVGIAPIDVTTGDYFWLQTWGPATINGTIAKGTGAVNSVSGLGTLMGTTGQGGMIGVAMEAIATNQGLIFLMIAP